MRQGEVLLGSLETRQHSRLEHAQESPNIPPLAEAADSASCGYSNRIDSGTSSAYQDQRATT